MSRELVRPDFVPMIAMAEKSARALRADMLRAAHARGFTELQPAHNAVFATLPPEGARAADMAARSGVTRQSMGEVIRDMVGLGLLESVADPADRRAKIVRFTDYGMEVAQQGYSTSWTWSGSYGTPSVTPMSTRPAECLPASSRGLARAPLNPDPHSRNCKTDGIGVQVRYPHETMYS